MAYMNQERKAVIAAALKGIIPKSWKYSLSVRHHSTIVLTIASAPVDLLGQMKVESAKRAKATDNNDYLANSTHAGVGRSQFHHKWGFDPDVAEVFEAMFAALYAGNHDRSDAMTDYFDVGWYVDVKVGRWDKPFVCTAQPEALAA